MLPGFESSVVNSHTKDSRNLDKALNEVCKMAALDHPGIVRYNHTWVEEPPMGWQVNDSIYFNNVFFVELIKKN